MNGGQEIINGAIVSFTLNLKLPFIKFTVLKRGLNCFPKPNEVPIITLFRLLKGFSII